MWAALEQNVARYIDLEKQMAEPAVLANPTLFTKVVKEHGKLAKVVKPFQAFQKLESQIKEAEAMVAAETDPDMRRLCRGRTRGAAEAPRTDAHQYGRLHAGKHRRGFRQHDCRNPRRHGRRRGRTLCW